MDGSRDIRSFTARASSCWEADVAGFGATFSSPTLFGRSALPNLEEMSQRLAVGPSKDQLSKRKGPNGITLDYIEANVQIEMANRIIGFENWSCRLLRIEVDDMRQIGGSCGEDKGKWEVVATAHVRVTLVNGAFHEDIGTGQNISRSRSDALMNAKKGAVTDARKRALRCFGEAVGNCTASKKKVQNIRYRNGYSGLQDQNHERAAAKFNPPQPQVKHGVADRSVPPNNAAVMSKRDHRQRTEKRSHGPDSRSSACVPQNQCATLHKDRQDGRLPQEPSALAAAQEQSTSGVRGTAVTNQGSGGDPANHMKTPFPDPSLHSVGDNSTSERKCGMPPSTSMNQGPGQDGLSPRSRRREFARLQQAEFRRKQHLHEGGAAATIGRQEKMETETTAQARHPNPCQLHSSRSTFEERGPQERFNHRPDGEDLSASRGIQAQQNGGAAAFAGSPKQTDVPETPSPLRSAVAGNSAIDPVQSSFRNAESPEFQYSAVSSGSGGKEKAENGGNPNRPQLEKRTYPPQADQNLHPNNQDIFSQGEMDPEVWESISRLERAAYRGEGHLYADSTSHKRQRSECE